MGWFCRLASTAVSLLREGEDRGLTRAVLARAGELIAPDVHAQALRGLSVTQVMLGGCFDVVAERLLCVERDRLGGGGRMKFCMQR